jgi:hypothetical protein
VTLLLATLAIFFAWETALSVVPWTIPAWLQPVLVYGATLAFVWPDWRLAMSVAGAVALLHILVVNRDASSSASPAIRRPRGGSRLPELPN